MPNIATPHLFKLKSASTNPILVSDLPLLHEAVNLYHKWIADMNALTLKGEERVRAIVELLNQYKDELEIELILKRGSPTLRRQKGQLKLDNSVLEEFLIHLVHP